ncbi:MAG: A-factor biosynthesis protein [Streptomyces sp.]|nr:A-factor biosynthesis protein [Streptomyces sp.]
MPQPTTPRPALTATVSRQLVHRSAIAETFLTGWERPGPDWFTLCAQWSRAHRLHVSPDRSPYEPLLVAETVPRCKALFAHAEYDAPSDRCFVLREPHLTTRPESLAVGAALSLAPALPAAAVDRALPADVVPVPFDRPRRRRLRMDTAHPVFFHSLDHVPGMLLLEAARQAARVRVAGLTGGESFHAAFHHYAEQDGPTWIKVTGEAGTGLEVRGFQGESPVFECEVGAAAR